MFYLKCILLSFFIIANININAAEKKNTNSDRGKLKIIFLPFENYSESGIRFLSKYISEQLKDNFKTENDIERLDYRDLKSLNLKFEYTYGGSGNNEVFKIMNSAGASYAVAGRYIIHDKNITINWSVFELNGGKVSSGGDFSSAIDSSMLSYISDYSITADNWIKINILKQSIGTELLVNRNGFLKDLFVKIENSSAGNIVKNRWFRFLAIFIVFFLTSRLIVYLIEKVFLRIARRTKTDVDQKILECSKKPSSYLVIFFGIKISIYSLETSSWIALISDKVITALIIIVTANLIARALNILVHSWGSSVAEKIDTRVDDDLIPLFNKILRVVIYAVAVIMILSRFSINIAPLIASLGIAGFAIGFAVKDTLSNIIGGIILILDNSFVVGDKVTIDGDTGIIKEVGLRNTKLQTYDNEIIVIPNGELMNMKFKNYVLPDPKIRVMVNFGVAYGSDVEKVSEIILNVISSIENICIDPAPAVDFIEMGDFSLNFAAKFWVPAYGDQYIKKLEATKLIYNALNANGIDIPFPTQTVHIER